MAIFESVRFLCEFASGAPAILTVRSCQPDADSTLIDLEAQAALLVIVGLLAQFREFGCVGEQTLFQLGIVGIDLCGRVFGIVIWVDDFVDSVLLTCSNNQKKRIVADVKQGDFSTLDNAISQEAHSALAGYFHCKTKKQDMYI